MLAAIALACAIQSRPWLELPGGHGPGRGRHLVFLCGDEEYRSEEGLPQLARILSARHGFRCTVLFSVNSRGEIDPEIQDNEPGMEALGDADACVMLLRFRHWPDAQMKHFVDYYLAGKPIVALRTSTHAFDYPEGATSVYSRFGWRSAEWPGGFGKQVLGETWLSHWGQHGSQATRGILSASARGHPILRGVDSIFGTTDVYEAHPPVDATILAEGEVVQGLSATDPPAQGRKKTAEGKDLDINSPMMPVAWIREPKNERGKRNRVFTCTMGAATDLLNEGLRRLLVNGVYWGLGLEVPRRADVRLVGTYNPSPFGFGLFKKGVRP